MDSFENDHDYSSTSLPSTAASQDSAEPGSTMLCRLRDREMLRKRKAEAQEKDSIQWALGDYEISKRQKKGQGAGRGKGQEHVVVPAPQPNPQPPNNEEAETVSSMEVQQDEPFQDLQDLFDDVQLADLEGILGSGSPLSEEDMMKLIDEIQDVLNNTLEKNESDNDMHPPNLF
ncbi:hemogen [Meleagris gallopavo]|uniref:hemogen n=1 Tax=Meleagris gallopavo TaxID=9103 RepID=UPI000549E09F|nr:hemogen [Meleagris gallopavo]